MGVPKKLFLLGVDAVRIVASPVADLVTLGGTLTDRDPDGPTYTGEALGDAAETIRRIREELDR